MIGAPKVPPDVVRRVLEDPPDFIEKSYLPAWRAGRFSTEVLAGAVVAALGVSPYDQAAVDEVLGILASMDYGGEPPRAVWL